MRFKAPGRPKPGGWGWRSQLGMVGSGGCWTVSSSLLLLPLPLPEGWLCLPFCYDCEVVQTRESQMTKGVRLVQKLLENRGRKQSTWAFGQWFWLDRLFDSLLGCDFERVEADGKVRMEYEVVTLLGSNPLGLTKITLHGRTGMQSSSSGRVHETQSSGYGRHAFIYI